MERSNEMMEDHIKLLNVKQRRAGFGISTCLTFNVIQTGAIQFGDIHE